MKTLGMTESEQKLLEYAHNIMKDQRDPLVSENIAKVFRNILFRSRAHTIDEIQSNIESLEEINNQFVTKTEIQKKYIDGPLLAYLSLLQHDQLSALSMIHRVNENNFYQLLDESLRLFHESKVVLNEVWKNISTKISDERLESSITEWVTLAANYSANMLPLNPIAAFSIWLQAGEWNQKFPSKESEIILVDLAYRIMFPYNKSLYRMNKILWIFIKEQEHLRSKSDNLVQRTKIASLLAAIDMTIAEFRKPEFDEADVRKIWKTATPWITEELPSKPEWQIFETAISNLVENTTLEVIAPVKTQLDNVVEKWMKKFSRKAKQSIRINKRPSDWIDQPLYAAKWTEIKKEIKNILFQLAMPGRIFHNKNFTIGRVRYLTPSFYPDFKLIEVQVQAEDQKPMICDVLIDESNHIYVLNGQSPTIHNINAMGALKNMNEEQAVADYLRFFCNAVWGEGGPFRIVELISDIPFSDLLDENLLNEFQTIIENKPFEINQLPDNTWKARVFISYQNALFGAEFKIVPTGIVEMTGDNPIAADLPVRKIVMQENFRFFDGVWESLESEPNNKLLS